jgi:Tol biopolymer transport system component
MTGKTQSRTQLRWLDRSGQALGDVGEPADYTYGGTPNISPDGRSAVLPIANLDRGTSDVWLVDLASGRRRKLTVDTQDHPAAVWMPDGKSVVVITTGSTGGLDVVAIDGTLSRRVVLPTDQSRRIATDFVWPLSAWGDRLLYWPQSNDRSSEVEIHVISLSGNGHSQPLITAKMQAAAQFSPDGRWVAYVSEETGRSEVFVAAFPQPGGRWQVSQEGGTEPRWNRIGRELFFLDLQNNLVSVEVEPSTAGFQSGASRKLFQFHGAGGLCRYDVAPDGNRFLVTVPLDEDLAAPVTLITDWTRKTKNL